MDDLEFFFFYFWIENDENHSSLPLNHASYLTITFNLYKANQINFKIHVYKNVK